MEDLINVEELVEFIRNKLSKDGVDLSDDVIMNVLDLEMEFLEIKGLVEK